MALKRAANLCAGFQDLKQLSEKQIRKAFGGKALGLYHAWCLGVPVPPSFFFPIDHYKAFLSSQPSLYGGHFKENAIQWLLEHFAADLALLPEALYAVRSSSQYEDAFEHSFAGIFDSQLNVNKAFIPEAIADVWESCYSLRVKNYVEVHADVRMGIVLQPMIEAKYSGVAFSRHPSPSHVGENKNCVIEFAPLSGDQIVQGKVTPYRLSGSLDNLAATSESKWMEALLESMLKLQKALHHEVDIEFVVDRTEKFWLVQQRPISRLQNSHVLDLTGYVRKYKRALKSLDCELLIEGCALYLAPYLEIPYQMEKWLVLATGEDGVQELWVHKLLDQAVVHKICQRIDEDASYLTRIVQRYELNFQKILQHNYAEFSDPSIPLTKRFFSFCEFILPLEAHYYVPMFMIDALYSRLVEYMIKIDTEHAEDELFKMGTWQIPSLMDIFLDELRELRKHISASADPLPADARQKLKKMTQHYAFLKCRAFDEAGYTEEDLFSFLWEIPENPPADPTEYEGLKEKYFKDLESAALFSHFREWMRIRNQEMEYLMFAFYQSRPLFEEICSYLSLALSKFWDTSREVVAQALNQQERFIANQFSTENLAIYRHYGKTRLHRGLHVLRPSKEVARLLKGKTVYGKGKLQAKIKVAHSLKELEQINLSEKTALVTGMTTPDFIPYLKKKICALITDEGGILCHAAIIAREIPIPCIVGTGMATETLIDGSTINIDFDKGEISLQG